MKMTCVTFGDSSNSPALVEDFECGLQERNCKNWFDFSREDDYELLLLCDLSEGWRSRD